ncbi:hypothetical protein [Verminephrobacter eiseniae]|uniref:hypothetical protein n=1 Tax=Verminephrobacter eiseniae TaxID=364317 RepID=UPI002237C1EA|nr:hypothetical protein [Verminephrobacter eiseniae]
MATKQKPDVGRSDKFEADFDSDEDGNLFSWDEKGNKRIWNGKEFVIVSSPKKPGSIKKSSGDILKS